MRSLILTVGVLAVVPSIYYPCKATWKYLGGSVSAWEWAQYFMETLGGQLLAGLLGLSALALALGRKRIPLFVLPVAILGVLYGFEIASKYSHDWGHDLFDECSTGRLERTLLPYNAVAVIAFGGMALFDAVNRWTSRKETRKTPKAQ